MRRAALEIVAVILTGAAFLVFENVLHRKLEFLVPCILGWTCYILWRAVRDRAQLREWGIRRDTLAPSAAACGAFLVAAGGGLAAYRWAAGWSPLPAQALLLFALYPIWGFIQQFVVQALVADNLRRLGAMPAAIVPASAVLFGLAHWPDWPLVALCAGAGAVWTIIHLRYRNLVPLAVTHAWLGTLTYYWILERDPWRELFPP